MLPNSNWCIEDIELCIIWQTTTHLLSNDSCHVTVVISVNDHKPIRIHFTGHALCALNSSGFGVTVKCLTFSCCRHWKTPGTLIDMLTTACACKTRLTIDRASMHEDLCVCQMNTVSCSMPNDVKNGGKGKKHKKNSSNLQRKNIRKYFLTYMSDVCTCKTHHHVIRVIPWVTKRRSKKPELVCWF